MKKILLLAAVSLCLFAACSEDDPIDQPFMIIKGENSATTGSAASSFTLEIISSSPDISIISTVDWLSASLSSSNGTTFHYEVTVNENTTGTMRNGKVTFKQNDSHRFVFYNLTQLHDNTFFFIEDDTETTLSDKAATFTVRVTSSSPNINAEPTENWIGVELKSNVRETYYYNVTVAPNTTGEVRNGKITFTQTDNSRTAVYTIIQNRVPETVGAYILSEGDYGSGNGQLAYYDFNKASNSFVKNAGRTITNFGETPNDIVVYGSKFYVAVSGTAGGYVEVRDAATGNQLRTIDMPNSGTPRRIAVHNGNVYLSVYPNNVARIDTTSYSISTTAIGGNYPEGICVYNQSLYICNSGYGSGNTISVVSIANFTETEQITVPQNPINIGVAGNELYFNTASVWGANPYAPDETANLHVLNPATKAVHTFDIETDAIAIGKDYVYASSFSWDTYEDSFHKVAIASKQVSRFAENAIDNMDMYFTYKLSINSLTGEVFATQQMGPYVYRLDANGNLLETYNVGANNGNAIAFIKK